MCLNWMLLNELLGWTLALKTTIQSSGEYKFSDGGPILALWRQKNQRGRTVQNFRERGQYKKSFLPHEEYITTIIPLE
uniref:Putative secreted protein n=1 Tax=Xenopsylla cheopis TaxID=163159 RepID=A0A6M2DZD6_XENCH